MNRLIVPVEDWQWQLMPVSDTCNWWQPLSAPGCSASSRVTPPPATYTMRAAAALALVLARATCTVAVPSDPKAASLPGGGAHRKLLLGTPQGLLEPTFLSGPPHGGAHAVRRGSVRPEAYCAQCDSSVGLCDPPGGPAPWASAWPLSGSPRHPCAH